MVTVPIGSVSAGAVLAALLTCRRADEVEIVAANALAAAFDADQCLVLRRRWTGTRLAGAAGLARPERHTAFATWVERVGHRLTVDASEGVTRLEDVALPEVLRAERVRHLMPHAVFACAPAPDGARALGVLLARERPFEASELDALHDAARVLSWAAWAWRTPAWPVVAERWRRLGRRTAAVAVLSSAAAILALPVRLSTLAAVEVAPRQPVPITAPQDGVIERLWVRPNQTVVRGDPLFSFDEAVVRSRLDVARRAVEVAQAELQRAAGKAFGDEQSRTELQTLRARVREREAEAGYLAEMARRLSVNAPADGIAVFGDASDWEGRPVQTGERIMVVADPGQVGFTLHLAPEDAIEVDARVPVRVHLDVAPLDTLAASIVEASYETVALPDGRPVFLLKARLEDGVPPPRIGLKGTAVIYGPRVSLAYQLLRKPLRALRRLLAV